MPSQTHQKTTLSAPSVPCPAPDCALCPRLADFRVRNRALLPDGFNGAVPSFGAQDGRFLVIGLAPGLRGANFSGRPFTGDYAGDLLYSSLIRFGFAQGAYAARADDGLVLKDCRITNAVRCVPPENKPTPEEMAQCLPFLKAEIESLPRLRVILSLGRISHDSTLRACGERPSRFAFAHGAEHQLGNGITLVDSYHCSRYNTQTRRLTEESFHAVFARICDILARSDKGEPKATTQTPAA